jgi:hypothetical protein
MGVDTPDDVGEVGLGINLFQLEEEIRRADGAGDASAEVEFDRCYGALIRGAFTLFEWFEASLPLNRRSAPLK